MTDNYKETIINNLQRVDNLVEGSLTISAEGYPLFSWLEISPIDVCNRKCVFCPKSDLEVAPNQRMIMPALLYEKIARELKEISYKGTVMLAGYGEPLLSDKIVEMTRAFAQVCNTEITTNGDPLTPQLISELMEAGVSKIVLSLYDGPHQIEKYSAMFAKAGVPENFFILRDRWYASDKDFGVKLTNRAGNIAVGNQPPVDQARPCYYPHYMMMIDWNGNVHLCTQDWNRKIICGNLMFNTVTEVWRSSVFKKYRNLLANGKRTLLPCAKCNADGMLHGEKHMLGWRTYYHKEETNDGTED